MKKAQQAHAWYVATEVQAPNGDRLQINYLVSSRSRTGAVRGTLKHIREKGYGVVKDYEVYDLRHTMLAEAGRWSKGKGR